MEILGIEGRGDIGVLGIEGIQHKSSYSLSSFFIHRTKNLPN